MTSGAPPIPKVDSTTLNMRDKPRKVLPNIHKVLSLEEIERTKRVAIAQYMQKHHPDMGCTSAKDITDDFNLGYPECNYPLVSIPEMRKAAQIISQQMGSVLRDSKKNEATILVPGAGVTLNVLEIAHVLQRKVPNLDKIVLIYTEIRDFELDDYLKFLEPVVKILGKKTTPFENKGKETSYETTYSLEVYGKKVDIVYAVRRSTDKEDHDWFKKSYAQKADIIVFHEIMMDAPRDQADTIAFIRRAAGSKPQAFVTENLTGVIGLPPTELRFKITGNYDGHMSIELPLFSCENNETSLRRALKSHSLLP
ncbi:hypothetical protein HZC07_04945, partial [Candidatus Micrarchaeota archaeon]|nr:hypothetical protein [Candidatus Micrarchaeota archaeon]